MKFRPKTDSYNTWTWYLINKNIDKLGIWKFEIYLENSRVIDKTLKVNDENQ